MGVPNGRKFPEIQEKFSCRRGGWGGLRTSARLFTSYPRDCPEPPSDPIPFQCSLAAQRTILRGDLGDMPSSSLACGFASQSNMLTLEYHRGRATRRVTTCERLSIRRTPRRRAGVYSARRRRLPPRFRCWRRSSASKFDSLVDRGA